ncbi:MAG: GSCFA domain-containing protein [Flavobacterium sp.]|nr:GSCFA domain-containing protein [Flavobacterium sp.]
MQFTTKIPVQKSRFPIDYDSKILLLGSCFAENIGKKFEYFKFQSTTNPFGIIFNAVSLEKLIRRAVENKKFTEKDIFYHNELWHCYEVHSELSSPDKEDFLSKLNTVLAAINQQISSLTHCIITLGTSWVYRNIESNEIVANCHKVPQKQFTKELLSISQTEEILQNMVSLIHSVNPNCNFIFTVSPVRHIKDGFVENTLSKAHLITAIHSVLNQKFSTSLQLTTQIQQRTIDSIQTPITHHPSPITDNPSPITDNSSPIIYFPAFEIMMDELRDYRFYAEDMLHPNAIAIAYIWEQFVGSTCTEETKSIMNEIDTIQKSLAHKPFHVDTESHQKFLVKLHQKIKEFKQLHPNIDFEYE